MKVSLVLSPSWSQLHDMFIQGWCCQGWWNLTTFFWLAKDAGFKVASRCGFARMSQEPEHAGFQKPTSIVLPTVKLCVGARVCVPTGYLYFNYL